MQQRRKGRLWAGREAVAQAVQRADGNVQGAVALQREREGWAGLGQLAGWQCSSAKEQLLPLAGDPSWLQ